MSDRAATRWHVVTGKGGTGKTTVAGAMALTLARGGRRVLLVEVEGRQGLAQLFDTPPLPYEERKLAVAAGNGDVYGLAIDAHEAVHEYLQLYYRLGRAGRALDKIGAIDFATTIAPGLRDVLLTGKTYEAVRRRSAAGFLYDAVVMDAPPTGRIARFLNVNTEVAGLARVGPVHRQAQSIMSLLHATGAVHLVTILEEMPVQETADGIAELTAAGLPVGSVVVNLVRRSPLDEADLDLARQGRLPRDPVAAGLAAAGLPASDHLVTALLDETREHAERVELEASVRADITALGRPTFELPALPEGIDLGALYTLADELHTQGFPGD
jgi:anion-transporting  ArsA/GET3 family ATPase